MKIETYEQVLAYVEKGWAVVPVHPNTKESIVKWKEYQVTPPTPEQVEAWLKEFPDANWAVITGKVSGITVLDFDKEKGLEAAKTLALPTTLVHRSPRGWHVIAKYHPDYPQTVGVMENVDIRNDGGYLLLPPSSKNELEYVVYRDAPLADLPPFKELFTKKPSSTRKEEGWVTKALEGVGEGKRNDMAAKLAGHYRSKNISRDEAEGYLKTFAKNCDPTMPENEALDVVKSIYNYSLDLKNVTITEEPEFSETLFDYNYHWPQYGLTVKLNNIISEKTGLWCEIEITMDYPGLKPLRYGPKRFNLLTSSTLDKSLEKIVQTDWASVLEYVCRHATKRFREGDDIENILDHDVSDYDPWLLKPLVADSRMTILFGDGGVGKSTVALAALIAIQEGTPFLGETAGRKIRGLWLDWEDSGQPIAKRAQLLLGEWHGKHLARMDMRGRPLTDMADSLRRKIAKEGIGFIVIDSIGKACGSDASSQEVANKFSNAVDSLGVVALGIHHVTKNADSAGKPFGSTFWHGNARATIEVMGDPGGANGERHLVLANRKVNHGNILPAIGLQILYTDNKITLTKELPRYSNIRKAGI